MTAAVHPHEVDQIGESYYKEVVEQAQAKNIVAIGETGLDYHYDHSKRASQQEFLKRHLKLALDYQLPVVIHCREAFDDFFAILDQEYKINGNGHRVYSTALQELTKKLKRSLKRVVCIHKWYSDV